MQYTFWSKLSRKNKDKYKKELSSNHLRKTWDCLIKDYQRQHEIIEKQTGAPGYYEYWSYKSPKVKTRYEQMDEYLGNAEEGVNTMELSAAVLPNPSFYPGSLPSSGEEKVYALSEGATL